VTNLRRVRVDRGFSQRALAKRLGCTHVTVGHWERGNNHPTPALGKRLRDELGLPVDVLLAQNDEKPH